MKKKNVAQVPKSLRNKLLAQVANRVASIAFPSAATPIFERLREQQRMQGIPDPRSLFKHVAGYSEKLGFNAPNLDHLQTRVEAAKATGQRILGSIGPRKIGIASSPGEISRAQATEGTHQGHSHGSNGECQVTAEQLGFGEEAKGSVMKRKGKNSKYVEDQRWPVTLKQILVSKMLSQKQLKTASIENVRRMFRVQGGNATEREEVYYMFQRMLLEGFIRGVDLTKDLKKQGGTKVVLTGGAVPGASNGNVIGMSKQGTVYLKGDYWRRSSDEAKLALFYHEMGHELLNRGHVGSGIMKSGGGAITAKKLRGTKQQYNAMMNELFRTNAPNQRASKHLRINRAQYQQENYDPEWYPSADGIDDGEGYDPYDGVSEPPVINNYTTNIVPPSITPNVAAPTLGGIGATGAGFNQPTALPSLQLPTMTETTQGPSEFSEQLKSMSGYNDGSEEQVGNILKSVG